MAEVSEPPFFDEEGTMAGFKENQNNGSVDFKRNGSPKGIACMWRH